MTSILTKSILTYIIIFFTLICIKPDLFRDLNNKKFTYFLTIFIAIFSFYYSLINYHVKS